MTKKSVAWTFFCQLIMKKDSAVKVVDSKNYYCKVCFQQADKEKVLKYIYKGLAKYKRGVSTGNLLIHLKAVHESDAKVQRLLKVADRAGGTNKGKPDIFKSFRDTPRSNASMSKESKFILGRDIARLCSIDCLPFGVVNETGYGYFCVKHDIVANAGDLPSDRNIATNCLQDVYTSRFTAIKEMLAKESELVKDTAVVALDIWTDLYWYLNYQCHRLICLNDELEMRNVTLTTSCFMTDRHTAKYICKDYRATLKLFDIAGKNLTMVRDRGSNVVKAFQLDRLDSKSRDCIAHGLHNLITFDGIYQVY
ncbi:hypothetical protein QYM36_020010 [Artemia franciscana]|uniref:Transposase n=1 Tax=Artemia franciscana TaxID=6661 RepID=A0AA88KSV5_ARTSF|nr:hypothetical protein QYM36_020010 [Artemia franciscana]